VIQHIRQPRSGLRPATSTATPAAIPATHGLTKASTAQIQALQGSYRLRHGQASCCPGYPHGYALSLPTATTAMPASQTALPATKLATNGNAYMSDSSADSNTSCIDNSTSNNAGRKHCTNHCYSSDNDSVRCKTRKPMASPAGLPAARLFSLT